MATDAYDYIPATLASQIPPLYATEKLDDPTVWIKLFTPDSNWTWYLTEFDPNERMGFGLVIGPEQELGYISLDEMTESREELDSVQTPPSTETWFPLAHSHVLERTIVTLEQAGFRANRTQLALSHGDSQFFGTIDLESPIVEGVSLAVGVRNSIDKSLPIAFAAGERIFICDNLAFRGEVVVARKHTRFGADRFAEAMVTAVAGLAQFQQAEAERIHTFRRTEIADTVAESLILRAYERQILSHYMLPRVLAGWRQPAFEGFADRTLWSLENVFTGALAHIAKSNPQRFCGLTIALQGLLSQAAGSSEKQFSLPA